MDNRLQGTPKSINVRSIIIAEMILQLRNCVEQEVKLLLEATEYIDTQISGVVWIMYGIYYTLIDVL